MIEQEQMFTEFGDHLSCFTEDTFRQILLRVDRGLEITTTLE